MSLILQQLILSVNWVLIAGIVTFCFLFFGALQLLSRRADFDWIRNWVITIMLPLSAAIALVIGIVLSQTYKLPVTKPWFG